MPIFLYISAILATVIQSASSKQFARSGGSAFAFNAIKSTSATTILLIIILARGIEISMPTAIFGACYGISLSISMYSGYKALSIGPMSLTSMLVSFSVIIPIIWGVAFMGEPFGVVKITAVIILVITFVVMNADKTKNKTDKEVNYSSWIIFILLTFITNGACSVLQKEYQRAVEAPQNMEFTFVSMLICAVVYIPTVCNSPISTLKKARGKRYACLAGVLNALAGFLTLLIAKSENASVLFPIISAGTIIGSMACGRLIFRERLKANHYVALALGIASIVLLKI